jgi:hypothetical protein
MSAAASRLIPDARARPFDPAPKRGLSGSDFRRICPNGLGDGHNSFPHSVSWYRDHLYVGTTRSNFQMLKIQTTFKNLPVKLWPVEGPNDHEGLYRELDRRAQIWRYDPVKDEWEQKFVAPYVTSVRGGPPVARETGFRSMVIYRGDSDTEPALYVASWAVSRSPGALLLRCADGEAFLPATPYGIISGLPITATRVLVPFKGRLYTSPTGTRGYDVNFVINLSGMPIVFETTDPASGRWRAVSEPGFGEPGNQGIFVLCPFQDHLYAGTFNNEGFQIWRSDCEGEAPYRWTKVMERGAYRGAENQIAATMKVFKGALYVATAIQNGGNDLNNNIGPAGSEVIRIHPDHSWDLIIGNARSTPYGKKIPLSALPPGFGNVFNGYFWAMEVHDDWLYLGTMDSSIWVRWLDVNAYNEQVRAVVNKVGAENIVENESGCDLWRTSDGANWLPVTRVGFDNRYNLGVRNLTSTPYGLFAAVANPFGPRVAVRHDGEWRYEDNPRGGLEMWLGRSDWPDRDPNDAP